MLFVEDNDNENIRKIYLKMLLRVFFLRREFTVRGIRIILGRSFPSKSSLTRLCIT